MCSGGHTPHGPTDVNQVAPPQTLTGADPLYDFLEDVPSPITISPSSSTHSAAAPSLPPPQVVAAAPPPATSVHDPYAFMALVPSPVTLPALPHELQNAISVTILMGRTLDSAVMTTRAEKYKLVMDY
jgi:hypothetical protein